MVVLRWPSFGGQNSSDAPCLSQGPFGIPGPIGPPGLVGDPGVMQRVGQKGEDGARGSVGPPGLEGKDGQEGLQGPKGFRGLKGSQVSCVNIYECSEYHSKHDVLLNFLTEFHLKWRQEHRMESSHGLCLCSLRGLWD